MGRWPHGQFLGAIAVGKPKTYCWMVQKSGACSGEAWRKCPHFFKKVFHTHIIHVWYIYLHLVDFYGKCIYIYTIHGWYGIDNRWLALGFLNHQQFQIEKLDLDFVGNLLIGSMKLVLYSFRSMNGWFVWENEGTRCMYIYNTLILPVSHTAFVPGHPSFLSVFFLSELWNKNGLYWVRYFLESLFHQNPLSNLRTGEWL